MAVCQFSAAEDHLVGDRRRLPLQGLGHACFDKFLELRLGHRDGLFLLRGLPPDLPHQPNAAHERRTENHGYDGFLHGLFPLDNGGMFRRTTQPVAGQPLDSSTPRRPPHLGRPRERGRAEGGGKIRNSEVGIREKHPACTFRLPNSDFRIDSAFRLPPYESGLPQFGQALANRETCRPQSGQGTRFGFSSSPPGFFFVISTQGQGDDDANHGEAKEPQEQPAKASG